MRKIVWPVLYSLALILNFSSCALDGNNSANQIVKGIDLSAISVEGDIIVKAGVLIYLKNVLLGHVNLPIYNPDDPRKPYGRIIITPPLDFNGIHKVAFELNLSKLAPIPPASSPVLPNGKELPFTGIDNSKVIMIEIDSIKSRVYFALDHDLAFMGFAVVIRQFDAIGGYTGGIDFFPLFKYHDVIGTAGLFSGVNKDNSGLAFFVNLSSVLSPDNINDIIFGEKVYNLDKSVSYKTEDRDLERIENFFRTNITKDEEKKIMKAIYEFTKEKRRVDYLKKN